MGKTAFIYPGQGAQKCGMGRDFYENGALARAVYDAADEVLPFDIKALCFEENEQLNETQFTQPALVTTCLAMTSEIRNLGIKPDITAGLSLGEYAAIAAAGGMTDMDAIAAVRERGIFMSEAVPKGEGMMMAVIGLKGEDVKNVLQGMDDVWVANYNCPGQVVITGKKEAVMAAGEKITGTTRGRTIPLNVSGPFHSPLLCGAGERLEKVLENITFHLLEIPYVANVSAQPVTDSAEIKHLLKEQVSSSVLWEQTMRFMIAEGVDTFIEIGPGKTLAGFMKKIDRKIRVISIGSWGDLEKISAVSCQEKN